MEYAALLVWILAVLAIGGLSVPLATWLFRGENGAPFAVAIGVGIVTVVGHLAGHFAYGWPALLAGLAVLAGGSILAGRRIEFDLSRYAEASIVFVLAFLLIVAIRAVDPSAAPLPLAVGEKPLDFGILASLDRSPTLPPEDMWFAGEPVVYHYGGHLATNLLSTFTGLAPALSYNLGLATFYAMLVTAAYGLAGMIVEPYAVSRRLAGGLAAFFVGIASNLDAPAQFAGWLLPQSFVEWLLRTVGANTSYADWTPEEISSFWYWDASRVLPVDPTAANPYEGLAATEFPLFAWLNGDLHAHMMSQPFMLLAAALGLLYWRLPEDSLARPAVLFGALPPLAGLIGFVNVFSLPTVGGLAAVVVFLAPGDPTRPLRERVGGGDWLGPWGHWALEEVRRVLVAVVSAAAVVALGVLWTLPFWLLVLGGGNTYEVALWGRWSPLGSLLLVHGGFLAVFVAYLAGWIDASFEAPRLVAGGAVLALATAVVLGAPALGLFVPIGLLAWWLARNRNDAGYEFALILAGAGLVLLVELLTLDGQRFNVIFKYYAPVWLFFAVAAGAGLARLASGLPSLATGASSVTIGRLGRVLMAVLVVTTGLYGAVALQMHFQHGSPDTEVTGPTLDATAYVGTEYPDEAPAIEWLDEHEGQPTIVTQAPSGYGWYPERGEGASAPASMTGLPTVLGRGAERLYRGDEPFEHRASDVETIYTGAPERQRALLDAYDVTYVYVGPAERNAYDGPITVGNVSGVTVVQSFDAVTIYEVTG